jgi:argininosuccinate lyase
VSEGRGAGARKQWGARFSKPTERTVEAFSSSLALDFRLLADDVAGSLAHARMLGRQEIIAVEEADAIVGGLGHVFDELTQSPPSDLSRWEDVHSLVEDRLRELIGDTAGRLHTGRSRNDQVALDLRLFARRELCQGVGLLLENQRCLLSLAERYPDTPMPGYTHLQRAQPVLVAHHLLAYREMFERDLERLRDAYRRADVLPLGSAALAGAAYPLDRQYVARLLGFGSISRNSLDAVSDRDFVVEHLAALALIAMHLSRLAEELVLWCSSEFGFACQDDAFATGSSIMPQKKNPDVAELVRGRTGQVYGSLITLLTVLKGLPLSYNRDLQEDKAAYFGAIDTAHACLELSARMLKALKLRPERLAQAAAGGFSTATDLADFLVKRGLPFREAHAVAGAVVNAAEARSIERLADLPADFLATFHPLLAEAQPDLSVEASLAVRDIPGGTAPRQVKHALLEAKRSLARHDRWLVRTRQQLPKVEGQAGRDGETGRR